MNNSFFNEYALSPLSEHEYKEVKTFLCNKLRIEDDVFSDQVLFYNQLRERLKSSMPVNDTTSLTELFEKLNIYVLPVNSSAYLFVQLPVGIFKFMVEDLINYWEDIWMPPADDAIVLYIPSIIILMVTHYDVIYYTML
jgi:hypothetical protein